MVRALLLVLLPIALPLLLYFGYLKYIKRPAAGGDAAVLEQARQRTVLWLVLGTLALAVASFAVLRLSGGVAPGTKLQAPRLIDGQIVPSRPVE